MKKRILTSAVVILTFTGAVAALQRSGEPSTQTPPAKPDPSDKKPVASLTGKWAMELNMSMGQSTPTLNLKQDGEKITGTYTSRYGTFPLEGTLKARTVQLFVTISVEGMQVDMAFSGEVAADGQSMKGEADLGQAGDATWVARREKTE
jgi:hypothetical protein